ncbi:MAG: triose-phosphate isomerase [Bacteriovoracaceae bacterium]
MPKTYMVGNWKMNQGLHELNEFFIQIDKADLPQGNFWIAPQMIHIHKLLEKTNINSLKVGAQNCSDQESGAYTGEVSAKNLAEMGAQFVILGHSERRSLFKEDDQFINRKVKQALRNKLIPILCVGETLEQREAGKTLETVLGQVEACLDGIRPTSADQLILAYEPVWAIGTGKTASPEQADEVHSEIRKKLDQLFPDTGKEISILYGGSVKPSNIKDLLSQKNVNGGLVGGASLKASDFIELCKATK